MRSTAWSIAADGTPGPDLYACLKAAVAAPSVHNTQPWRFQAHDGVIEVYADRSRRLGVLDPAGRELMISVGAAVFNLRVEMLARGRLPVLNVLPDPARPDLAARVTVGPVVEVPATARRLARAIPLRHTNRRPFTATPVPPEVRDDLVAAARAEGGDLVLADGGAREALLDAVRTAERRRSADPAYWSELDAWTRDPAHRQDGVPPEAFGPWDPLETVPIRDFGLTQPTSRRPSAPFEKSPTLALLYSRGDTREDWIRAGAALERTLLTATVHGLSTTLMTQPLEFPELRSRFARPGHRFAQAVIRIGYGPLSPPSPRRPIAEVLRTEERRLTEERRRRDRRRPRSTQDRLAGAAVDRR